ncbi:MAG: 5-(carboxyamino)imidazole ribonucleotide mutase [Elusimicrobia bacterium RIFOXYD2_FULL_34_15]|nr:MAG: 5-(carboxyamino)imidazole ribonucleotide mutase [Elusimicrobia bacterium RIFOXYD2_FULL_34_15]
MANPLVSIVMGSDSDLPQMKHCAGVLEYFDIPFEMTIASAHRSPEFTTQYAKNLTKRGVQVVIAGAGGAAHLPGVVASLTTIPVIGIPLKTDALSGVDSLYSIIQMPKGIPVATVAIGETGAYNAALLAAQILALKNQSLKKKILSFKEDLEKGVVTKSLKLKKVGYRNYK